MYLYIFFSVVNVLLEPLTIALADEGYGQLKSRFT